jgi:hypothetical protein
MPLKMSAVATLSRAPWIPTAEQLRLELHVIERINDLIVVRLDLSCIDGVVSATVMAFGLRPTARG